MNHDFYFLSDIRVYHDMIQNQNSHRIQHPLKQQKYTGYLPDSERMFHSDD